MKKLCLFCEHFHFMQGDYGYSEYTPGNEPDMYCEKRFWDSSELYNKDLRDILISAETCNEYTLDEWAKERYGLEK